MRTIPSLDGFRAFSFLLVFLAHAGLKDVVPGGFGVTVFFFLSGFLITTLMRAEYEKKGFVNLKHFWLRRALRILPPFYLVLVAATAATWLLESPNAVGLEALRAQALHFVNYWIIYRGQDGLPMGTGVYWSLAVEEHFYLLFPWLYVAMRKLGFSGRSQAMILWSICAAILAWRCILVLDLHASTDRTYLASDTRIDSILFGCALAVWNNPVLDAARPSERLWKFAIVPLALGVLIGCLIYRDADFRETLRYTLQGLALTPLFIAAIAFKHWLPFKLLNLRPVVRIGELSYSLYLVHEAVLFFVEKYGFRWAGFWRGAVALAVAFVIAWSIHIWIERPCAELRRKLSD